MGACNPQRSEAPKLGLTPRSAFGGIQGVDISNNNGSVSFTYLRSHGISFVYAKGDEACHTDSELASNIAKAAAIHMPIGIYDFARPGAISSRAEAACLAALARYALSHHATLLPVDFDIESFGEGLSGQGVCNWLHAAESDLRADLPGVKIAVYGSVGTYPGCFPNGTEQWPADWGVSFAPSLPGYSGTPFNWQWFGPRFASTTLAGMDRDKGSSRIFETEFGTPPKPKRSLNQAYKVRRELRADLTRHHCRQPPWHVAVGLSGRPNGHYEHSCHVWLSEGRAVNREIRAKGGK